MEQITFTCETITPMFLAGADGMKPELRAPSIKGALRFWWRAMNGHLVTKLSDGKWDYSKLKEAEGKIFGDTKQKSRIVIKILEEPFGKGKNELLPHKENPRNRSPRPCYIQNQIFKFKLELLNTIQITSELLFSLKQLKSLSIVVATLGGLGKRSRRGFGSFKITTINDESFEMPKTVEEIKKHIEIINPHFQYSIRSNYPTIEKIEIGEAMKSPYDIGKATHDEKGKVNNWEYEATIGAGTQRFASPIYISILASGQPIITTLNSVPPNKVSRNFNPSIQASLKKRIL